VRTSKFLALVIGITFFLITPIIAHAYLFWDTWGVPTYNSSDSGRLVPTSGPTLLSSSIEDVITYKVDPGYGGDTFDVEAIYFGLDTSHAYFAVVTGFPESGSQGYEAGDFAIDWNGDGGYEFGIDIAETAKGTLYYGVTDWNSADLGPGYPDPPWGGISDPWSVNLYSGTTTGSGIDVSYSQWSGRYVIEAMVDVSFLTTPYGGESALFHWTMECGNDAGDVPGPVPEPGTMLLLGSGLIGLICLGRKKLFKKS